MKYRIKSKEYFKQYSEDDIYNFLVPVLVNKKKEFRTFYPLMFKYCGIIVEVQELKYDEGANFIRVFDKERGNSWNFFEGWYNEVLPVKNLKMTRGKNGFSLEET